MSEFTVGRVEFSGVAQSWPAFKLTHEQLQEARAANAARETDRARRATHSDSRPLATIAELRRDLSRLIDTLQAKHMPVPGAPPDPALAVRKATLIEVWHALARMLDALPVEREEVMRG